MKTFLFVIIGGLGLGIIAASLDLGPAVGAGIGMVWGSLAALIGEGRS